MTRVVLGTFTPSVLLSVARRIGRLDEHGLEVQEVPVTSSPAQFRSLIAGELDLAFTSPDNTLAYRFDPSNPLGSTTDVRIVSAIDRGLGLALYGRPGVTTAEQLRGAKLGVDVPTSGFALAMYAIGDALGVSRDDYELVALGSTPQRLQALLEGRCDATMLNAGNELPAEDAGCVALGRASEVCGPYLGTVVATIGSERVAVAEALTAALRTTAREIADGTLAAEARAEAATVLSLPEHLAGPYVDRLTSPDEGLILDDAVPVDALSTILDLRRRYLPAEVDGVDPLADALSPEAGLIAAPVAG